MAEDSLRTDAAARIDPICVEFEAAWKRGERPNVDDHCDRASIADREALRAELQRLDAACRQRYAANLETETHVSTARDDEPSKGKAEADTKPIQTTPAQVGQLSQSRDCLPRIFGDYELIEEISRGGMGVVYKARQARLTRTVAVKMILSGQFADADEIRRFHNEAEAAAGLDHPGIVTVFESGEIDGQHFFSMGFVDGQSLAAASRADPCATRWPA